MRIVFLGTSPFALPTLERLSTAGAAPALVVTRPERARGRGRKASASPVAAKAAELGLPVFTPERVNADDAVERIAAAAPELIVVVAYGQILREPLLSMASKAIVNLHGSLLPRWRGAAPIARAIQHGDALTGVTLQYLAAELDAGDVIGSTAMEVLPGETAGELTERMAPVAAELLVRFLPALERGSAPRVPQDPAHVTIAPLLRKEEGRVPWTQPAETIERHVRAMTPWPGAATDLFLDGGAPQRVVLRAVELDAAGVPLLAPGALHAAGDALYAGTGTTPLRVRRLLRAGRSEMDAAAFLRGVTLGSGARFQ